MSRSFHVWLLASALVACVGCGGGDATDSDAVAENSSDAAPGGGGAGMTSDGGGGGMMGAGGGGMEGMMGAGGGGMMGEDGEGMEEMMGMDGMMGGDGEGMEQMMGENGEGMEGFGGEGGYPGGGFAGGEGGAGYGGAVAEKVPDTFEGKATLAFRQGKDRDAMQYLYAHALTTDAGAERILPTIRWVSRLRQPKLAVRWGAGFVVTAPRNFEGDPKPVGSEQKLPTRGGRQRGGGDEGYVGGGGGEDYGAGGGAEVGVGGGGNQGSLLSKGAGELGDKLVAGYTKAVMRGDYGDVLKQALAGRSGGNQRNVAAGEGLGYGEEGAGGAGYGAEDGLAGPGGAGGLVGGGLAGGGLAGGGGGGGGAAAATEVSSIMPGLSMLGIGTQKELITRAREDEIDVIVIIDMKLRVNSEGLVTNESTLYLLDTKTPKRLHTTKKFNNITIQKARAEGKEDGIDQEFEKLFAAVDENFKMSNLPAVLNAQVAKKRIAGLIKVEHENPLPVLVEARMYHSKGLLDENLLFAAYERILGVDSGRLLATGEEEDKKKVLDQWLPEN